MMFLVGTQDLLVIFISLELLSLSLYTLAAFSKRSLQSWEAALKYFLFGGMSAAFLLFGFSLLYGLSNSTSLTHIAAAIHGPSLNPLLAIAIVTTAIGLGFKIAAAPFHFWAPDVYQGAPAPTRRLHRLRLQGRQLLHLLPDHGPRLRRRRRHRRAPHLVRGWVPVLALMAALSMLLGNLVAIRQTSLRRLLAYSAIAHAGYMLLAIVAHTQQASPRCSTTSSPTRSPPSAPSPSSPSSKTSAAPTNSPTSTASAARPPSSPSRSPSSSCRSPASRPSPASSASSTSSSPSSPQRRAPPTLLWLVVLAIAMSAVSLYYYLRVLKAVYVAPPADDSATIHIPILTQILVLLLAAAVILLGCAPNLILKWILAAIQSSGL